MRSFVLLSSLLAACTVTSAASAGQRHGLVQVVRREASNDTALSTNTTASPAGRKGCDEKDGGFRNATLHGHGAGRYGWWRHKTSIDGYKGGEGIKEDASEPPVASLDKPLNETASLAGVQQNVAVGRKTFTRTRTHYFSKTIQPSSSSSSSSASKSSAPSTSSSSIAKDPSSIASSTLNSSPAAIPSQPTSGGSTSLSDWEQGILDAHNRARNAHSAGNLVWSEELVSFAETWAKQCLWKHGGNEAVPGGAGQNMNVAVTTEDVAFDAADSITQGWMNEEKAYDPANPQYSHFTQVVWKGTTELGCYQAQCENAGFVDGNGKQVFDLKYKTAAFTVCNYRKAGNVRGQFGTNVVKIL